RRAPADVARNILPTVARNVAPPLRARQDIDKTLPPLPPKPEEDGGAPKVDGGQVEQAVSEIMRLAGKDLTKAKVCADLTGTRWVLEQLREGRSLKELVQAARDLLPGKAIDNPWRYLQRALPEWLAARQRATAPQVCAGDDELLWEMRLDMLESDGYWPPDAGGRPGEPYCRVPRNLLAQRPRLLAKRGA
ncbi:MAG: hypothetical protein K2Q10_11760, partial [Rhodospirillales bacterium]|nr:hypothetical protein [Rhodospirillales bacterium]